MKNEFLKKHPRFHYLGKCLRRVKDNEYIKFVLEYEQDSSYMKWETLGDCHKDKNILYIRNFNPLYGFFADYKHLLNTLAYAEQYGLSPFIWYDKNYLYAEQKTFMGTDNPFEYYFEQPAKLTYAEVIKGYNVLFAKEACSHMPKQYKNENEIIYKMPENYMNELAIITSKYIRFNKVTKEYINSGVASMLSEKKTLGIHYRGTDFKVGYNHHPKAVHIEQIILKVKQAIENYKFERIFLATDDRNAISKFKESFPMMIFSYEDVQRGDDMNSVAFSKNNRENHHYKLGREVLRDMVTLSKCDGLVAGISQVSDCARITKKSYGEEYLLLEIIDNGLNVNGNYFKAPTAK